MSISAVVGLLSILFASSGCASTQGGQAGPGAGTTLDRIKTTKTVTFGYRDSSVPFSFMGPDQTTVVNAIIDVQLAAMSPGGAPVKIVRNGTLTFVALALRSAETVAAA